MKKIVITGATGSIGRRLVQKLVTRRDEVTVFSQNPEHAKKKIANEVRFVKWNYQKPEKWKEHLNGAASVVHLAGANLSGKRWNDEFKKIACDSRVLSTRNLVEAFKSVEKKPKTFICANAVGIYGNRYDEILDEKSIPGNDFLAILCIDWENEAKKIEQQGVRFVSVRTGLVLAKNEGLMKKLVPSFKIFFGGWLGGGMQWFPWIHIDDIVGIYLHTIGNEGLSGAFNAASPGIVRMKEFAKTLGNVLSRPALFPVPKFAIIILKGELGKYSTDSQRIAVSKILKSGYEFKFENLKGTLRNLLK